MDEKIENYRKLSDEVNELGRQDSNAAAARAREIAKQARDKGDEGYALFFEGETAAFESNFEKAEQLDKEALKLLPDVDFILSNYALSLSWLAHEEEALEYFDKALDVNDKSDHALSGKGVTLSKLGRNEDALEYYDKALAINDKSEQTLCSKGVSLSKLGRKEEALESFDKALVINDKSEHALFEKGKALSRLGRDDEAIEYYDKAFEMNDKSDLVLSNKGVSLSQLGRDDEAIECFNKALKINDKSDHALSGKGVSLLELGRYKEALECYERSEEIKPWDETDLDWLVDIFSGLDRLDEAGKVAKELIEVLKEKNKSTKYAEYQLNQVLEKKDELPESKEEEDDDEELDEYMQKVLDKFGPERRQELLDEIEKQEKDIEKITKVEKRSKKLEKAEADGIAGFLSVLRRWNSFTPKIGSYDSKGGGYFLYLGGKGIVIDPGFDYVRNFLDESFNLFDIDYIFITHAHLDHMADLEALFTLLHEANKKREPKRKIDLYLNLGCMKKLAGWLNLNENYINRIHVLEQGVEVKITENLSVLPTKAKHKEIIDEIYSLGFIFESGGLKVGLTGDTGWEPKGSLAEPFENCQILVAHLGSIYPQEFAREDRLHKNHLGLLGISGMIGKVQPKLCVISEFGEELIDLRREIADGLTEGLGVKCIAADLGTEILVSDPPRIRCAICGKFFEKCDRTLSRDNKHILYICEGCNKSEEMRGKVDRYYEGERWELWEDE